MIHAVPLMFDNVWLVERGSEKVWSIHVYDIQILHSRVRLDVTLQRMFLSCLSCFCRHTAMARWMLCYYIPSFVWSLLAFFFTWCFCLSIFLMQLWIFCFSTLQNSESTFDFISIIYHPPCVCPPRVFMFGESRSLLLIVSLIFMIVSCSRSLFFTYSMEKSLCGWEKSSIIFLCVWSWYSSSHFLGISRLKSTIKL